VTKGILIYVIFVVAIILVYASVASFLFQSTLPFCAAWLILIAWSVIWAYNDAKFYSKPPWAVALFVFLLWPISLLLWIVFR
jgi:hypothetical protein